MLNRERIEKTESFLKERFDASEYLNAHPERKAYRLEHSFRVANITRQIAGREGFDESEAVIAGLLHDISYCEDFGEAGWREHGRRSAQIARPFLTELGLPDARVEEICFGIAIHVDDEAGFPGERTAFALSVGDADNIDRFGALRIHEGLCRDGFLDMALDGKRSYVRERLERLRRLRDLPMATRTAGELWLSRLAFASACFERLAAQLEASGNIVWD